MRRMILMQTPDEIRSYFKIENGEYVSHCSNA